MADIIDSSWNSNDESNTGVAPDGVQGGYAPSTVAPIIRAMRGATKRFYEQINPIYTSTGSANAYALTYAIAPAKLSKGIQYAFFANHTNTGAATLNINGLGAKAILSSDKNPLAAGQVLADTVITLVYDGSAFRMVAASTVNPKFTGTATLENLKVTGTTSAQLISTTGISSTGDINLSKSGNVVVRFNDAASTRLASVYANNTGLRLLVEKEGVSKEITLQTDGQLILPTYPTLGNAAASKTYVDNVGALQLSLTGGTVTGDVTFSKGMTATGVGVFTDADPQGAIPYGYESLQMKPGNNLRVYFGADQRLMLKNNGDLEASGIVKANGVVYAGNTILHTDGNVQGTLWGGYLSTYLNNRFNAVPSGRAYPRRVGGGDLNFNWSGKGGTPTWLWGWRSGDGVEAQDMNVYNPANFSVNYANSAGSATNAGNANTVGGWSQGTINNQIEDRSYWRTRDYMLAEHVPVGGYSFAQRRTGSGGVNVQAPGSELAWAGGDGSDPPHNYLINYGTWTSCGLCAHSDTSRRSRATTLWKRIG